MALNQRPLSKVMIKKLRDCYEKSASNDGHFPCLEDDLKGSLAALYKRGLVGTQLHEVNGKQLLGIVVTDAGVRFIKQLDNSIS